MVKGERDLSELTIRIGRFIPNRFRQETVVSKIKGVFTGEACLTTP